MPRFIYDIIPPDIKRKAEATVQEVSRWFKIFKLFLKTSRYGTIILILGLAVFGAFLVFAFSQERTESIEIFPTQYSGDPPTSEAGWQNMEKALDKDLGEEAKLAEFSSENSANLFGKEPSQPVEEVEELEEAEDIEEGEEIVSESEEQEISSPSEEVEEILPEEQPIEEQPIEEEPIEEQKTKEPEEETELNLIEFWKHLGINIGGEEGVVATETPETETIPSEEVILEENINEEITTESETKADADKLLNLIEQTEEVPSISEPNLIMHSLIFSGFNSEKIGEFDRVQLAFSWAAQKRETNEILLVEYRISDGEWKTLFLVQLNTEEHSNFSNNGYWKKKIPDILSWEDINSLEVRFILQSIDSESQLPIYLDAVWLEVEYEKEIVDSIYQQADNEEPAASLELKTRKLEKEIRLYKNSSFKCGVEPFQIYLFEGDTKKTTVILRQKGEDNLLEIGNLPIGIDIRFIENDGYLLSIGNRDEAAIEIYSQVGSQKGNFSVPILYYPEGEKGPAIICQLNLINK